MSEPVKDPESASPPPVKPRSGQRGLVAGLAAALIYALIIYGWTRVHAPGSGMLVIAFLLGAPVAAVVMAVRISDPHGKERTGQHIGTGALTITLMLISGGIVLREGAVCLIMAAPIFYGVGILTAVITGAASRTAGGRVLCLAVLALPLVGVPLEDPKVDPAETRYVVSTIVVDAPTEVVWDGLINIRAIDVAEQRWNFTHDLVGVPRPVDARMEGAGVGAVRHLTWAKGVRFQEHITEWRPGQSLAWTFEVGPEASTRMLDEHLRVNSDYLRLEQGRYTLRAMADGRTHVTLTTRYWIRTPINSYAGWWGQVFLGDFHRNVLGVIKARAETA